MDVSPGPRAVLESLASRPGHVVSRAELMQRAADRRGQVGARRRGGGRAAARLGRVLAGADRREAGLSAGAVRYAGSPGSSSGAA